MKMYLVETERDGCFIVIADDEEKARDLFEVAMFPIPYFSPTFELLIPADGNTTEGFVIQAADGSAVVYP